MVVRDVWYWASVWWYGFCGTELAYGGMTGMADKERTRVHNLFLTGVSLSLSFTHTHMHTHAHTRTHAHTLFLSLSLSFSSRSMHASASIYIYLPLLTSRSVIAQTSCTWSWRRQPSEWASTSQTSAT
eukprot:2511256-Rhodomonas_salina.4